MKHLCFLLFFTCLYSLKSHGQKTTQDPYLIGFADTLNEQYGYKNTKGEVIIPLGKYGICYTDTFSTYAIVSLKGKGLVGIDRNEKVLYNVFIFDNGPDDASTGLFRIIKHSKIGYADVLNGSIVIYPKYDCAWPFKNGVAKVSLECEKIPSGEHTTWQSDHWHYIDKTGKRIWAPNPTILYIKQGFDAVGRGGSTHTEQTIDSTKIITTHSQMDRNTMIEKKKSDTTLISLADWKRMTQSINVAKFFTLPERTGCGSCKDGGDYWLEITTPEKTYRIVFETADDEIKKILNLLPPIK